MNQQKTCPSYTCTPGVSMLGALNNHHEIIFNTVEVIVDEDMVSELHHEFGEPEKHFRFSNTCVEKGCRQWNGSECSVINKIVDINNLAEFPDELPNCNIRTTCRWFFQRGADACKLCPYIITDNIETLGADEMT